MTQNPYSHCSTQECALIEPSVSFSQVFVSWALFCLLTFAVSLGISLILGILLVAVLVSLGADENTAQVVKPIYAQACGFLLPLPVSFLFYWWSIRRILVKAVQSERGSH